MPLCFFGLKFDKLLVLHKIVRMKLLLLLPLIVLGVQNPKFVRVKINDEISIKIPEELTVVPEGQVRNRSIHFRAPLALYTDTQNEVDLAFNQNPTRWREVDIGILKDFYKSNILSLYDDVEFIQEKVVDIRGKKFAVFEFISSVKGDKNSIRSASALRKYTYIQYTIYNGSTLVCNLTSSIRGKQRWSGLAHEIMQSIAFK